MSGPFHLVTELAERLTGFDRPWFVAGGWAIDLFLGRVTRDHHDLEIALFRADQHALRAHLPGWRWRQCTAPGVLEPWDADDWLTLPLHQLLAAPPEGEGPAFDALLNDLDGDTWRFRREPRVTRPAAELGAVSPEGWPYLRPEITLLYKAKYQRPQDEQDFLAVVPHLTAPDRAWLYDGIAAHLPDHPWLATLRKDP